MDSRLFNIFFYENPTFSQKQASSKSSEGKVPFRNLWARHDSTWPAETERGIKGNVPKIVITLQTTSLMSYYLHARSYWYSIYFLVWQKLFTRLLLDTRLLCWFLSILPSQTITLSAASACYLPAVSHFATHLYPWLCSVSYLRITLLLKLPHAFHLSILKRRGGVPSQQWGLIEVHLLIVLPQSCTSGCSEEVCNRPYGHRRTLFGTGLRSLEC